MLQLVFVCFLFCGCWFVGLFVWLVVFDFFVVNGLFLVGFVVVVVVVVVFEFFRNGWT